MKRSNSRMAVLSALLLPIILPLLLLAQVPSETLANGVLAARKKEADLLAQYTWNSRIEVVADGKVQDVRIDQVNLGPNGVPQRTVINDTPGSLPNGFLRKRIAEKQRKQTEQYIGDLSALVDQYALPSAGKVVAYIVQAKITPVTTPDNKTVLQLNGTNVVTDGDTLAMTLNGTTMQTTSLNITTTYNGDPVTISATFKVTKGGPNHLQYATVEVPNKNITVMIHNFDYVPNN